MASKTPEEFQVGDTIAQNPNTRYSGSEITSVRDMQDGRTEVTFRNLEIVQFFNGVQHEMKE